jgi:superoxide reductase
MQTLKDMLQTADWKTEKHVPVIECKGVLKKGEAINVTLTIGKEIPHPNTTEHHIAWVSVYFQPEGEKFVYQIGRFEFSSHGASTLGPNTSTLYTTPSVNLSFKTEKSGTLLAVSYCNIHGLWENSQEITVA